MTNISLSNIARILFAIPLFAFGISHYLNVDSFQLIVPEYMPFGGVFWTYASGTSLILAGTGILIKKWDRLAALCLAPTIFAFGLMVHLPNLLAGDAASMSGLLKDTMIGAACLLYAAHATQPGAAFKFSLASA